MISTNLSRALLWEKRRLRHLNMSQRYYHLALLNFVSNWS